jgi:hypothetical protein
MGVYLMIIQYHINFEGDDSDFVFLMINFAGAKLGER